MTRPDPLTAIAAEVDAACSRVAGHIIEEKEAAEARLGPTARPWASDPRLKRALEVYGYLLDAKGAAHRDLDGGGS
jgi:hypothetical protein